MKAIQLFLIFSLLGFLFACSSDDLVSNPPPLTKSFIVGSHKVPAVDPKTNEIKKVIAVKVVGGNDNWFPLDKAIRGFDYEEGFEYVLSVQSVNYNEENMGTYKYGYIILEMISKIEKDSEDLPEKFE